MWIMLKKTIWLKNNTLTLQDQNLKKIKKHSHENVGLNELKMRQKFCVTFKKLEGGFQCQLTCRFIVDEYILHTLNNAHNLTKKKKEKKKTPRTFTTGRLLHGRKLQRPTQTISRGMFLESFTTLTCFLQLPKHIPCTHVQPVIFHADRTLWGGWRGVRICQIKMQEKSDELLPESPYIWECVCFCWMSQYHPPPLPPSREGKKHSLKYSSSYDTWLHRCLEGIRLPESKEKTAKDFHYVCTMNKNVQWIQLFLYLNHKCW